MEATTSSRCRSTATTATRSAPACRRRSGASTATSIVARPEVGAIVHTHSPFATTLACLDRGIPAFHYMIAIAGGSDIRCAPYATFGTQALSDHAVAALAGRRACLLAHHGMIATAPSLAGRAGAGGRGRDAGRDVLARAAGRRTPAAVRRRDARRAGEVRDLRPAAAGVNGAPRPPRDQPRVTRCDRRARRAGVFRNDALNPRRGTPADSPTASATRRRTSSGKPALCAPPEELARPRDVGIAGRDVARPPRDDLVRDTSSRRRLERAHDLQHRVPAAGAEVDGRGPRRVRREDPAQRRDVPGGEVDHVDVVAHAGAVGGGVVAAEDAQPLGAVPPPPARRRASGCWGCRRDPRR